MPNIRRYIPSLLTNTPRKVAPKHLIELNKSVSLCIEAGLPSCTTFEEDVYRMSDYERWRLFRIGVTLYASKYGRVDTEKKELVIGEEVIRIPELNRLVYTALKIGVNPAMIFYEGTEWRTEHKGNTIVHTVTIPEDAVAKATGARPEKPVKVTLEVDVVRDAIECAFESRAPSSTMVTYIEPESAYGSIKFLLVNSLRRFIEQETRAFKLADEIRGVLQKYGYTLVGGPILSYNGITFKIYKKGFEADLAYNTEEGIYEVVGTELLHASRGKMPILELIAVPVRETVLSVEYLVEAVGKTVEEVISKTEAIKEALHTVATHKKREFSPEEAIAAYLILGRDYETLLADIGWGYTREKVRSILEKAVGAKRISVHRLVSKRLVEVGEDTIYIRGKRFREVISSLLGTSYGPLLERLEWTAVQNIVNGTREPNPEIVLRALGLPFASTVSIGSDEVILEAIDRADEETAKEILERIISMLENPESPYRDLVPRLPRRHLIAFLDKIKDPGLLTKVIYYKFADEYGVPPTAEFSLDEILYRGYAIRVLKVEGDEAVFEIRRDDERLEVKAPTLREALDRLADRRARRRHGVRAS